ncbi:MAG: type II toxin-antitoxin system RelE/ParE family toxin [Anaerolineales bacterium]|nr:type II toxin-antitoxin system RelE/ParE family toxin [Anaerolineales bacterium]
MSRYSVYITPQAWREIKDLPGNVRQRIKRAVDDLENDPHPVGSKQLDTPKDVPVELRRIRLDRWRILYTISESDNAIDVLAIRKRPPYDYGDLYELLTGN